MEHEQLKSLGIDVDALIERLMGKKELVPVFLKMFVEDKNFDSLNEAIAAGNSENAFIASHTLKGMCANLSMTDLYKLFSAQVEYLRAGHLEEAVAMMPEISAEYKRVAEGLKQYFD